MLKLEDFITEKTLEPFIEERRASYEDKAIGFLRKEFAPALRLLDDDQLRKVVKLAYGNARKRDIATEREHLKYLIPVMFWGSHFESDPQYRTELIRAGWICHDGQQQRHSYVAPVLEEVDNRVTAVMSDLEKPRDIIAGFSQIYKETRSKTTLPIVVKHMLSIWPARTKLMAEENQHAFIQAANSIAQRLNFKGNDSIMYICFAQHFGYRCTDDPLFPWIKEALSDDGRSQDERRLCLEEGVLKYWDGLLDET